MAKQKEEKVYSSEEIRSIVKDWEPFPYFPFALDIDKIVEFIFEAEVGRYIDTEIEEILSPDMEGTLHTTQQSTREVKSSDKGQGSTFKYSLIELFLKELCEAINTPDGSGTIGDMLIFNGMLQKGFVKRITTNDTEVSK